MGGKTNTASREVGRWKRRAIAAEERVAQLLEQRKSLLARVRELVGSPK